MSGGKEKTSIYSWRKLALSFGPARKTERIAWTNLRI